MSKKRISDLKNSLISYHFFKILLLIMILILITPSCAPEFKKHYLCSEINGSLKLDNVPIKGATIIRSSKSHWYDKKTRIDSVKTDKNGIFKLKERTKFATFTLVHQAVVKQLLTIRIKNQDYKTIDLSKMNYDKNGELRELDSIEKKTFDLKLKKNKIKLNIVLNKNDTLKN